MKLYINPPKADWVGIQQRPVFDFSDLEKLVSPVLADVKANGDTALLKYTEKFDGVALKNILVTDHEFAEALHLVDEALISSIKKAIRNISVFHQAQKENFTPIETERGIKCWRKSVAIERVGLYIPGGTAPLFSTVLMLAVPAKIAGCNHIILSTPPNKTGKVHPAILVAAQLAGVSQVVKAGGAQAVGALAYGTKTVPSVYKIFGPGNQYVTMAKQLVNREGVAIDMPAGPSEVLVYADDAANPTHVAADLLSQAEHGIDSQAVLVCDSEAFAQAVSQQVNALLAQLPRAQMTAKSVANSVITIMPDAIKAIDFINQYAPEHLIINRQNYTKFIDKIINAGSVFLGPYTCESLGDYASGTNHTLPTNGFAKAYSGVSLDSFVKKITFQEASKEGLESLGPDVARMAEAEMLEAHKLAVTLRLKPDGSA